MNFREISGALRGGVTAAKALVTGQVREVPDLPNHSARLAFGTEVATVLAGAWRSPAREQDGDKLAAEVRRGMGLYQSTKPFNMLLDEHVAALKTAAVASRELNDAQSGPLIERAIAPVAALIGNLHGLAATVEHPVSKFVDRHAKPELRRHMKDRLGALSRAALTEGKFEVKVRQEREQGREVSAETSTYFLHEMRRELNGLKDHVAPGVRGWVPPRPSFRGRTGTVVLKPEDRTALRERFRKDGPAAGAVAA